MRDLTALRSLIAVVDCGSIAEAARLTGYSAAAVSRHISSIELEFGVELFRRTGRSVHPSIGAKILSEKAQLLLDEAAQFERDARALARGEEGVIRLAYFRAAGTTVIPPALAIMAKLKRDVKVVLLEEPLSHGVENLLRAGEADLGFVWSYPGVDLADAGSRLLNTSPLFSEALVLLTAADRDDLHVAPTDLSRLTGENFAGPPGHLGSAPLVDRMFLAAGLPAPAITQRPVDHAMLRSLISADIVVALVPALGISDEYPGIRRSVVAFDWRRTHLASPAGTADPTRNSAVQVLAEAIRRASGDFRGFGIRYIG